MFRWMQLICILVPEWYVKVVTTAYAYCYVAGKLRNNIVLQCQQIYTKLNNINPLFSYVLSCIQVIQFNEMIRFMWASVSHLSYL